MIGQTISHYKILEKLGGGGMGVVYKAEDTKLKRAVALKFLPPELTRDDASKERFVREAQAASVLQHNNICTIHEINETEDGQMFICMDYYDGETLKKKTSHGPLPVKEAIDIGIKVARGLAKAHGEGMVHRDIKPANVMVTNEGEVKIVDFGVAKLVDHTKITKTGMTVGTAAYMSPEQTRGEEADSQSDIFSLGVVLYELLTGHPPFRGQHEAAVGYSIVNENPTAPRVLRPSIPGPVERVVLRCLEKNKEKRFQTAEEVAVELDRAISKGTKPKARVGRRSSIIAGAILGIIVIAAASYFQVLPRFKSSTNPKSIAVLPFANLSADPENEYFSDGVTEDILTQLSKIKDLTVVSRTSVMRYKNTDKNLREIGEELSVAHILEGSVRRSDNQIRIVSQLIDARTDEHLWAETYDRDLEDIFEIQSDVAKKIAAALEAEFSPEEEGRIEKEPTKDLQAYDYYLKGRDYYYRYQKDDNERAIRLFEKALAIDPRYALAYAGIADAYGQRVWSFGFAATLADSAIGVAETALSIDPDLAEAHKALGNAYLIKGWMRKALGEYHKAVELNPNYATAVGNVGVVHSDLGEHAEAFKWYKKSLALNPVNANTIFNIGWIYLRIGEHVKAEQWYKQALEIEPDYIDADILLSYVYLMQKKYVQATKHIEKVLAKNSDNTWGIHVAGDVALFAGLDAQAKTYFETLIELAPASKHERYANICLGYLLRKAGRSEEANKRLSQSHELLKTELERGSENCDVYYDIAAIHAVQGKKTEANVWFGDAIESGYLDLAWASLDPLLENLRADEQFKETMTNLKTKVGEIQKQVRALE